MEHRSFNGEATSSQQSQGEAQVRFHESLTKLHCCRCVPQPLLQPKRCSGQSSLHGLMGEYILGSGRSPANVKSGIWTQCEFSSSSAGSLLMLKIGACTRKSSVSHSKHPVYAFQLTRTNHTTADLFTSNTTTHTR